ncbi:MAG: restriction endonuclease [candidate division Zixibacteria bacterium]|nr:restriction endonuclease [candidate division Zixibacteria bacterium]
MCDKRMMVIRTNDSEKQWLQSELKGGRLRQGWGITGMQLEDHGEPVPLSEWEARYSKSAKEIWAREPGPGEALKRFRILSPMTDLRAGDIVVIPKMPSWDKFTIASVKGKYWFDADRGPKDYGHVIPVDSDCMKETPYFSSIESRLIVKKLRGYQCAVNNVWDSRFVKAIEKLVRLDPVPIKKAIIAIYSDIKEPLIQESLNQIRHLTYADLEELVKKAFEAAGYQFVRKHYYDNKGGDADLVFDRNLPLVSEISELALTVFIQVKQKSGKDADDLDGVEQLVKISANNPQSVRILISTADGFSDNCKNRAGEEQVTLVSGLETAEFLMRYL